MRLPPAAAEQQVARVCVEILPAGAEDGDGVFFRAVRPAERNQPPAKFGVAAFAAAQPDFNDLPVAADVYLQALAPPAWKQFPQVRTLLYTQPADGWIDMENVEKYLFNFIRSMGTMDWRRQDRLRKHSKCNIYA